MRELDLLTELRVELEVSKETHMFMCEEAAADLRKSDRHIEALEYQIKSLEDPDT